MDTLWEWQERLKFSGLACLLVGFAILVWWWTKGDRNPRRTSLWWGLGLVITGIALAFFALVGIPLIDLVLRLLGLFCGLVDSVLDFLLAGR